MCGRYVTVTTVEKIQKVLNIVIKNDIEIPKNYNLSPGQFGPVITNDNPHEVQLFKFGYTPSWSKDGRLTINARADTKESNPENKMDYFDTGGKPGIYAKKYWSSAIRTKRCIIIADAFYEGPAKEKLSKPFLIHMRNKKRPFAMGGVWSTWKNQEGEEVNNFAIITVPANQLLDKIGHPRCPLIVSNYDIGLWLNGSLGDITPLFKPYPAQYMNAYPVDNKMKSWKEQGKELIQPIGQLVMDEFEYRVNQIPKDKVNRRR